MNSFHGAAFVVGLGAPESICVRRALKVALMLTDCDGPGYAPDNAELVFDVSDRQRLSQRIERLTRKSTDRRFDTICVYVAGQLHESGEYYIRPYQSEVRDQRISLESLVQSLQYIEAESIVLMLDICGKGTGDHLPEALGDNLMGSLKGFPNAALVAAVSTDREACDPSSPRAVSPSLNSLLLEWLVGRNTSLEDSLDLKSLQRRLVDYQSMNVTIRVHGDEQQIRVGQRFPWLEWNKRTTMPGHAVSSLEHLVDGNASVLVERVQQQPLSAATLAGLPNSLFASIWREALQLECPRGLMEKLARDRCIITEALRQNGMNRTATAGALGISRSTLYAKMRRLNITSLPQQDSSH